MKRTPQRPAWVLLLPLVLALSFSLPAQAKDRDEDGVYVYDLFRDVGNCLDLFVRLRKLDLRPTVILSIEQGPEFILDRPSGEQQLACVLRFLNGSQRQVKAMFLQDTGFLKDNGEAVRRAEMLGEFAARYPGELAGVQVDVEPHADTAWEESDTDGRRELLKGLHDLLRQLRPHLGDLLLGAAVPWWYAEVVQELPEAAPEALFHVADELYLMAYGDGSPPQPEDLVSSLLARFNGVRAFSQSGRTHIILASYEFASPNQLEAQLQGLRFVFGSLPNFAGTAVFHATSGFRTTVDPASQSMNSSQ